MTASETQKPAADHAPSPPFDLPYPRQCDRIATRSQRMFVSTAFAGVSAFLLWANFTELEKVTRGNGRVIPQVQNQIIQHFEGGIVREILVKEGDRVEKGAPLIRIENSFQRAELLQAQLEIRVKSFRLKRLDAEIRGKEFEADAELRKDFPRLVETELGLYETRRKTLTEQIAILDDQFKQKEIEISEFKSRWKNTGRERELVLQRVTSLRRLVNVGAVSSNELIENERTLQQIEGRISDLTHDIPKAEAAMSEISRRRSEARLRFQAEAEKERADIELQIAKLNETVTAMRDRSERTEVVAPISGTVNKLNVSTIGGVVKSGDQLGQIVPIDTSIAVEARIQPKDRAEVWPGQVAVVKISAYDFSLYGGLKGKVVEVSPDALQDEKGQPYFRIRLEAEGSNFGPDRPVVPGMIADVDILSGRRTIMETLIRPVKALRDNALRQ
ncbi:MAG TPA: HlyD family type I secretion periplasmic adaptor subunit [Beijerinckiaceae bacterium]|nr:HlyD family type I secretion periplasmic adaptor subunit [Beijerinckiaceae bacterium]